MDALGKREHALAKGRSTRPFDSIFDALADPTRRAIFERLSPDREGTVRALAEYFGISQQAVARHLSVLQLAGLVTCRHDGGRTKYYSARPRGAAPLLDWLAQRGVLLREQKTIRRLGSGTVGPRLEAKTAFDAIAELRDAYGKAESEYVAAARKAIADRNDAFNNADSKLLAAAERAIQTAVQRLASSIEAVAQRERPTLETKDAPPTLEQTPSHH